ncbi:MULTISPECIES: DUF1642 domain-containing protein [unclassified Lactococcus]|uniref:DUF1642 domain-containing protein n=1 Tax=unclassified Lactococcus TaxID=2643510 RepID=UPI0014306987|nr:MULTISPECIES: DUF1642 domain-containing protein [unclassified Lactococcus]KAF6609664.1 DUF1642 domain-containing protein [Lactococcus sp. EKM201L]KAF6613672.1 DUF1642 domain-containing protein [Lactococcus sp. EKM203L]KAF6640701.1 DUF1642 domain-containing protein [Lactococcus sp. EKM501L]KAF6645965.1 DUF1642 domain-containing protein [Lactococcus sp. EKM502L]KAF6651613.1 DUF1642 domain-containing protein [Lactococcus sp. EKM101L]
MTKNDYIEKITQNLEHLTKDELKDVSILTTAQLVVRSKFAERQQLEHEITNLTPKLQQQALPVVPDFIGKLINTFGAPEDGKYINYSASYLENQKELDWIDNHQKTWLTALLIGFTVEKPQLFYLRDELTGQFLAKDNQFKNEDRYFFWTGADPLTHSIGTAWKLTFTQQEIDSMETGSYEQIEVAE